MLILIDDLNDYVGVLGGHPQASTPNIDVLAAQGTLFTNAHATVPLCNPSRVSLMTGISPARSGIISNEQHPWRNFLPHAVSLNQAFKRNGYHTVGYGKIYHGGVRDHDLDNWDAYARTPSSPMPPPDLIPLNGLSEIMGKSPGGGDWGELDAPESEWGDYQVATWASNFINDRNPSDPTPFFLAVGFLFPHAPRYLPPSYYDLIAGGITNDVILPQVNANDLNDVGPAAIRWADPDNWSPLTSDPAQIRFGVHSYLAATKFVDTQVGRVLGALDASSFADNTIVILISDHGYHLSEKQTWRKNKLWEEDTRVPLIVRLPNRMMAHPPAQRPEPVNLAAVYPTLLELTGIPLPQYDATDLNYRIDYRSLVPLLENTATADWSGHAVSFGRNRSVSLRTDQYRLTMYRDGFIELYDHLSDPNEWDNIAELPQYQQLVADLGRDAQRYLAGNHTPFGALESCGAPNFDPSTERAIHIWKDCAGPTAGTWHVRATAGVEPQQQTFIGDITSNQGFMSAIPVGMEGVDYLDRSVHFEMYTVNDREDGFDFTYPAGSTACMIITALPEGAQVYMGPNKIPLPLSFNLETLATC